ncbi:hypothetical protein Acr_00g0000800 [Actinidia rufa]|uniref:Uncharacterized protein n=1 Tax=Actinidia rufa TaxID=165716 RepID=A0A7J0D6D2_9ERIC|nr:hypothetical protein Acr_00g0000800 [Actinidia rufa]
MPPVIPYWPAALSSPQVGVRCSEEGDLVHASAASPWGRDREELDERRGIERLGSDPVAERDFGDDCYGFGGSVETELDVHLLVWAGSEGRGLLEVMSYLVLMEVHWKEIGILTSLASGARQAEERRLVGGLFAPSLGPQLSPRAGFEPPKRLSLRT